MGSRILRLEQAGNLGSLLRPEHGLLPTRIVSRHNLVQQPLRDPAIVEEYDNSIVVPSDFDATLDEHGNVIMRLMA